MKESGKMISNMVEVQKSGQMVQNMREIIKKDKNMAMESISGQMDLDMKVNGITTKFVAE